MAYKIKRAFTISEMLVSLSIICVIATLFMTSISNKPNTNMVMFRKAYNIITNVIYDIMQNTGLYTNGSLQSLNATLVPVDGAYPSGTSKFCKIFASSVNTLDTPDCSAGGGVSFETSDGISWYLPPKTTPGTFTGDEYIKVDINGPENIPNCEESTTCTNPDTFKIYVLESGKIRITGNLAKEYLKNARKTIK